MTNGRANDYWEHRGQVLLLSALLLPIAAWGLNELIGYALVKPVCANGQKLLLTGLSIAMLAMTAAGGWIGWSSAVELRGSASEDGGTRFDRSYFFALLVVGFNLLIGLLIVLAAVPPWVLNPCE